MLLGGNLIIVNNWLMFPFIMAFAAFVTVFFYLSVPFVASAVMQGLSGTTATLQAGVQGAMQTAGVMVGAGLTAAGAAATFARSAAEQAAIEGTRTAAEGITAAGRIAGDFAGNVGFASLYSDSGGSDLPMPPRLVPASVGEKLQNRSNPNQIAHQTAPDSFTVSDSVQGTISHHKGNIYTPYAAQAAFNSHSSKARKESPPAGCGQTRMKFSAVAAITNNLVAARFWMILAILFAGMAVASPHFTVMAMRAREKVVILDPGGTLIYAPLLGFEDAGELHAYHVRLACLALLQRNPVGPDLPDLLKRLYLEPARKKAGGDVSGTQSGVQGKADSPEGRSHEASTSSTPARSKTGPVIPTKRSTCAPKAISSAPARSTRWSFANR